MRNSTFCMILSALLISSSWKASASAIPTNSSQDERITQLVQAAIDGLLASQVHPLPAEDEEPTTTATTPNPAVSSGVTTAMDTSASTTTTTAFVTAPHPNSNADLDPMTMAPVVLGGFTPSVMLNEPSSVSGAPQKNQRQLNPSTRILQRRRASTQYQYPGMVRKFDTEGNTNAASSQKHDQPEKLYEQTSPLVLSLPQEGNLLQGVQLIKENPAPAVNTFFDSVRIHNHNHELGVGQGQQQQGAPGLTLSESNREKGRLYYGDMASRPAQSAPVGPIVNPNGDEGTAHTGHVGLHAHVHGGPHAAGVGLGVGAGLGHGHSNYYYPQNLMAQQPLASLYKTHPHSHHGHGHGHGLSQYGPQAQHYSPPDDSHHSHTPSHQVHGSGHYPHGDYRGHGGHGNQIGPVIGKALQLLIPSALFLTGASALFPNRVHVPTNDNDSKQNERIKRSARGHYPMPMNSYESRGHYPVPSAYLRREHRGDDYGPELYPEDAEDYFDESASNYGERSVKPNGTDAHHSENEHEDTDSEDIETPVVFPDFKPMPALPVLRINAMKPVGKDFDLKDYQNSNVNVNEDDTEEINTSTSTTTTLNPNSTVTSTTVLNSIPTNPTPQEVMSKLLKASLHPTLSTSRSTTRRSSEGSTTTTTTSARSSLRSTLPTTVRSAVVLSSGEVNVNDQFEDSRSRDKPFFRQMSTEQPTSNPNVIVVTPQGKFLTSTTIKKGRRTTPSGRVLRRGYGKRSSNTASGSSFDSLPSRGRGGGGNGPNIIELGGKAGDLSDGTSGKESFGKIGKSTSFIKANRTIAQRGNKTQEEDDLDLSPDSPVVGLITNFAARDQDSPQCQKRALCDLAVRGSLESATKFEKFLWNLASLVPPSLSMYYDLQDTFSAVVRKHCTIFKCAHPNLDLQES